MQIDSATKRGAIVGALIGGLLTTAFLVALASELGNFGGGEWVTAAIEVIGISVIGAILGGAVGRVISRLR
jgi:uncharacterized membrane protein